MQSDSNLNNYQFGSGTGDSSPMMDSSMYSSSSNNNQAMSSPFKGDFSGNKGGGERNGSAGHLDYEPFHTRSSFNLNFSATSTPVQCNKVDKGTMCSSDILVRKMEWESFNDSKEKKSNKNASSSTSRTICWPSIRRTVPMHTRRI